MNILITGSSGFIGFHLTKLLLEKNYNVLGIDNHNSYYDKKLKIDRNKILLKYKNFKFFKVDIKKKNIIKKIFKKNKISCVVNLAAQAGVRYSLENPQSYIDNNILGFFNILESVKENKIKKFIYASTSSIYGLQKKFPIKENFNTNDPIQLYAATKKSNEVIANSYGHLYGINNIGLRFFTVYGPWGRPDMALFKFTKNIIDGKKINLFNRGKHIRDFTYVDDIVEAILKIIRSKKKKKISEIYNIGSGNKVTLLKYVNLIEKYLGKKSKKKYMSLQKGDVIKTHCNNNLFKKEYNYKPSKNVDYGIMKFIEWYKEYYFKK